MGQLSRVALARLPGVNYATGGWGGCGEARHDREHQAQVSNSDFVSECYGSGLANFSWYNVYTKSLGNL